MVVNVGAMISYEALMWAKQLSAEVGNFFVIAVGNFMVDENSWHHNVEIYLQKNLLWFFNHIAIP